MSLTLRISLVAAAVIAVFFLLTATLLERAFRENAQDAVETRLDAQLLLLMGIVEVIGPQHVELPETLPEARLVVPGGGLYARILDADGVPLWRSPSVLGTALGGHWRHHQFFERSITVQWELPEQTVPLTFQVLEERTAYEAQLERNRRTLWVALGLLTILLIGGQALALGLWGLRPLRRVRADLEALRLGENRRLGGPYPGEIQTLTDSINALLEYERERLERQQNALADLAHSLKTPLSVLRLGLGEAVPERPGSENPKRAVQAPGLMPMESPASEGREFERRWRDGAMDQRELLLQVERMQELIQHELNQAQRLGPSPFQPPVVLAPVIERTCAALRRLADQQGVRLDTALQADCSLRIESGALFELLGNVLDNALRHARSRVHVQLSCQERQLVLCIDDDGLGIPAADRAAVLRRGTRRDTRPGGQGLGLHIVHSLVCDHGGDLNIEQAPDLGGARIRMSFPGS